MNARTFTASLILLVSLTTAAYAQSPAGVWDVTVDAGGDHTAVLTLTDQGGTFSGTLAAVNGPSVVLQNIRLASDTLKFEFENPDYGRQTGHLVFKGSELTGAISMSMGEFPMTGKRRATLGLSTQSKVGELLANEKARAILDKYVPGLSTNPQIDQAAGLTLIELAGYAGDVLNENVMKSIQEELTKL